MKLHDLRPADGSRKERTRVGRGIAAGKGKTAGRGTKGQKARSGGSIPPWFEGGQTPLHVRIPKLRGFRNRFRIDYEVVNVGAIADALSRGKLEGQEPDSTKGKGKAGATAQVTVNQDILRTAGLVRSLDKPLKILGAGEIDAPLFVVADAFTASARTKIEAAGGTVSVLEVPTRPMKALGVEPETEPAGEETPAPKRPSRARAKATPAAAPADEAQEPAAATGDAEAEAGPPADDTAQETAEPAASDDTPSGDDV